MLNDGRIPTLISAEAGLLRDSLITILGSFPFIDVVGVVAEKCSILDAIHQFHPDLVLVDCSNNTQWIEIIHAIHGLLVEVKCVAIVDTFQTRRLALENGADSALIKGFTSQELQLALRQVFSHNQAIVDPADEKNRK